MAHLTIKHNRERGTYIEGTARGDGTNEILKAHGWRWGRSISVWFVPHSRDREMKTHVVNPTKAALEAARHIVTIERDETPRTAEEVEADAAARAARRAEYLEAKAQRRAAAAEKAHQDSDRAAAQLPPAESRSRWDTTARDATATPWTARTRKWVKPSRPTATPRKPSATPVPQPRPPQPATQYARWPTRLKASPPI